MLKFKNFSFGATSAVMTSLAIIIGLSASDNAKASILTALFIIAIADNISDSFGIHIHQESQNESVKEVRKTTFINFLTRLISVFIFIAFIICLPLNIAVITSILFGVIIIILLSYFISIEQKINPYKAIIQHLFLAGVVMFGSFLLREVIIQFSTKLVS